MENTFNIYDFKQSIDELNMKLLQEYNTMKQRFLQEKGNTNTELSSINNENKSVTNDLQDKMKLIHTLENKVVTLENENTELRKKLDEKVEDNNQTNRFDMIRSQAKEISAKDKEIMRLVNELKKYKNIESKVNTINSISGWSPTSSPSPVVEPNKLELNESTQQESTEGATEGPTEGATEGATEEPTQDSTQQEPTEGATEGATEDSTQQESTEEETFFKITYRKVKYYRDSKNKVYQIEEDDDIGKCIGDWVKQPNNKFKLIKH